MAYRVSSKDNVKLQFIYKDTENEYEEVLKKYRINDIEFFEGEDGNVDHSVSSNQSKFN